MARLFFLACFVLAWMCLGCGSGVSDRPVANVAGNPNREHNECEFAGQFITFEHNP
jgi:hypothetical protein